MGQGTLRQIPLSKIIFCRGTQFSPSQPLASEEDERLAVLQASRGMRTAPVVAHEEGGFYLLTDGERETRVAFLRGLTTILAYVTRA